MEGTNTSIPVINYNPDDHSIEEIKTEGTLYNDALVIHKQMKISTSKRTSGYPFIFSFEHKIPHLSENIIVSSKSATTNDKIIVYTIDIPDEGKKEVEVGILSGDLLTSFHGQIIGINTDNNGLTRVEIEGGKYKGYTMIKSKELFIKQKIRTVKPVYVKLLIKQPIGNITMNIYFTIMLHKSPLYNIVHHDMNKQQQNRSAIWYFIHTLDLDHLVDTRRKKIESSGDSIILSSKKFGESILVTNVFIGGVNIGQESLDISRLNLIRRSLRTENTYSQPRMYHETKRKTFSPSIQQEVMEINDSVSNSIFPPTETINRQLTLSPNNNITQFIDMRKIRVNYIILYESYGMNEEGIPTGKILFSKDSLSEFNDSGSKDSSKLPPIKPGRLIVKDEDIILLDGSNTNIDSNTRMILIGPVKSLFISQRELERNTINGSDDTQRRVVQSKNRMIIKNSSKKSQILTVSFPGADSIRILNDTEELSEPIKTKRGEKIKLDIFVGGLSTKIIEYVKVYQ